MKKLKFILPGTVFVFIVCNCIFMQQSCSYNELEDPKPVQDTLQDTVKVLFCDTANATYSGNVKAIIASECGFAGCHDAGFVSANFTTYAGVKTHVDNGKFKTKVFDNSTMPPDGFKKAINKDILKCWYDKGALNN